jgi:hypothetical protein
MLTCAAAAGPLPEGMRAANAGGAALGGGGGGLSDEQQQQQQQQQVIFFGHANVIVGERFR